MARLPRLVVPNHLHHVVARGNNEQPVFLDEDDYRQFLDWLRDAAQQFRVAITPSHSCQTGFTCS